MTRRYPAPKSAAGNDAKTTISPQEPVQSGMRRDCAFCPATANFSGEHIWSKWMRKLFKVFCSCF